MSSNQQRASEVLAEVEQPEAHVIEQVARALWEASHDRTAWEDATEDGPDEYRRLAAAAIAAIRRDRMTAAPTGPEPRTDAAVGRKESRLQQAASDYSAVIRARDELAAHARDDGDAAVGR